MITGLRAVALICMVAVLTGCSEGQPAEARFETGEGAYNLQCVHLAGGDRVLIGDMLQTDGSSVTIQNVSLRDARGVRVVAGYVLPGSAPVKLGVADVPPPPGVDWSARVRAAGARIPAHATVDIVLEVEKSTSATATARAIHVELHGPTGLHGVDSGIRYRFPSRCS